MGSLGDISLYATGVAVFAFVMSIFEKMCPKELEEEAHRSKGRVEEHSRRQSPSFLGLVVLTGSLQIKCHCLRKCSRGKNLWSTVLAETWHRSWV